MADSRWRRGVLALVLPALGPAAGAQDAAFLQTMRADVERLELDSNTARGEALQRMLASRDIGFGLETFEIDAPPGYPRSAGVNIVVTLGEGPRDIVIGGHYDAVWLSDGRLSRGAVDNAASAVILTRLAEALAGERLEHRIRIVFFDMEEIGLWGSRDYVARHGGDDILAYVNLDVNGYGDTILYGPTAGQADGLLPSSMRGVCAAAAYACADFARFPASDNLSFGQAGIPHISLAVLPAAEAAELDTMLNDTPAARQSPETTPTILRRIHSTDDTAAHIDPAGMAITLEATLELVRGLDAGQAP